MKKSVKNTESPAMSSTDILNMQQSILGDLERIRRLPTESSERQAYIKTIRQQQREAGIITKNNTLAKAFGG